MNQPIKLTTTRVPPARNLVSHSLPRRSPATVGRRWACRAVVRRRRDEGGSLPCHVVALAKAGHYSLLTVLLLALSPAPKAFGVSPAPDGGYPGGNTAEGQSALQSLTSGIHNTALGYQTLFSNTTGHDNMATGFQALFSNTTGIYNTGNGPQALYKNTTGNDNTATGFRALYSNTTGINNTTNGYEALAFNTTGHDNIATGFQALYNNTAGYENTANGSQALYKNTTGDYNTATGFQALYSNNRGINNIANGYQALYSNTSSHNTANGWQALYNNTTGGMNIALGYAAGFNLTTGDENVDIGAFVEGVAGESNTTRIANIGSTLQNSGLFVTVDAVNGTMLGYSAPSSRRYKDDIKPMDKASEAILALKPVSFRYKKEFDPTHGQGYGLIAEEVEKVNPDLVSHNAKGEVMTVHYDAVNAMLLNEFLKEHRTVQELKSTAAKQEATIAKQQKQIEALTTGLQKVSDQLELSESAPQMAGND